jgi:trehalose 6-phosphate synthase/phosphatase
MVNNKEGRVENNNGRGGNGANSSNNNKNNNSSINNSNSTRRSTAEAVQLNATDGLVVVSAFLPVVVHRDETSEVPKWTADWDYEALLSMQTHLRVTRVGVVKWKGWHGNYNQNTGNNNNNSNSSNNNAEEQPPAEHLGVPFEERYLVEECLRPFHCVPVWIDPLIFGEM